MKLRQIGSNMAEVKVNGNTVLFSYNTPVAACLADGSGFFRTTTSWSRTTSKHINKWLNGAKAAEKPQDFFDNLI